MNTEVVIARKTKCNYNIREVINICLAPGLYSNLNSISRVLIDIYPNAVMEMHFCVHATDNIFVV